MSELLVLVLAWMRVTMGLNYVQTLTSRLYTIVK